MKNKLNFILFISITLLSLKGFSQNDKNNILIQNFYQSCKPESYLAFCEVNKGIQLFDSEQYTRSQKCFEKALKKDEKYCDAWYLIAYCYQRIGDLDNAIESCNKSLSIESKNPSALIVKANTLFLNGDTLKAIELFTQIKELLPDKIDAYYGLALMLHFKGDNVKALQILNEIETNEIKTESLQDKKKIRTLKKNITGL